MAHYEGETLKSRIAKGPLKIEEATDLAIQISQGLSEAHAHGIVHRDIKPANILITERGVAKIVDFGLAKLAGQMRLTKAGSTVGTAAYMSPEQARGLDVDHRTDIWSLGVILFEMLTGKLPFRGEHEAALLYSVVHEEPQTVSSLRSDTPAQVERIIRKAFEKEPARRYQTMQELIVDLKAAKGPIIDMPKQEKSIVVLPFDDLSPDRDHEYFSDGLTEEIISDLSAVQALRVISRSSAMTFKGTRKKIPEIARELNVQYILEGSVRKSGNDLRITAQLIDAPNDAHLWAEKYSGALDDIFAVQENVSRAIVETLRVKLTPAEHEKIGHRKFSNVAAYECYLRARHDIFLFNAAAIDRAVKHLQNGFEILGDDAVLNGAMAMALFQKVNMGLGDEKTLETAKTYAEKALSKDPMLAQAHAARAYIRFSYGEFHDALKDLQEAYQSDPSDSAVSLWLSFGYIIQGKIPLARPLVEKVILSDPVEANAILVRGTLSFCEGRFDDAVDDTTRAFRMAPDSVMNRFWSSLTLAYAGRYVESLALESTSETQTATDALSVLVRLLGFTLRGERDKFMKSLTGDFLTTARRDFQYSYHIAAFLARLGMNEQSLEWLENAVDLKFFNYPLLVNIDPWLAAIRGEERFKKLMERVKKEWEEFEV
jgi:non-specific serine/threonine protein kinase